ncbi:MAG: HAD family phosphatase [Chlamydiota bacterium]
MEWIHKFDLFLFDFDGLLVDTERLHYQAYLFLCYNHGFELGWDFERYCKIAHSDAHALRKALYNEFPDLLKEQPDFRVLYEEKKRIYIEILKERTLELMPGAAELLTALAGAGIRRIIATHSPKEQIDIIRAKQPLLLSIPDVITREDYENPKPAPDAYLTAIAKVSKPGDRIIGFEDSLRGLTALQATPALPVLIAPIRPLTLPQGVLYFPTLKDIAFT